MFSAFDKVFTPENILFTAKGALMALVIAAVALTCGLILGTIGATCRNSKNIVLKTIANLYVTIIRGTPLLLQILMIFSVIPSIYTAFTGKVLRIDPILIGMIALSINSGAYQTELIRSGINGVDKGQWEACETLGLSSWKTMKLVILPQAFKRIVPPLISEFITLIKDTSLLSSIGVIELMKSATTIGANYYAYMPPLFTASAIYLAATLLISKLAKKLERKLAESD